MACSNRHRHVRFEENEHRNNASRGLKELAVLACFIYFVDLVVPVT